jgi:hypothetical protein
MDRDLSASAGGKFRSIRAHSAASFVTSEAASLPAAPMRPQYGQHSVFAPARRKIVTRCTVSIVMVVFDLIKSFNRPLKSARLPCRKIGAVFHLDRRRSPVEKYLTRPEFFRTNA